MSPNAPRERGVFAAGTERAADFRGGLAKRLNALAACGKHPLRRRRVLFNGRVDRVLARLLRIDGGRPERQNQQQGGQSPEGHSH